MAGRLAGFDSWRDLFIDRISRDNQRMTPQRLQIAETLFHHGHLNVDELHRRVREEGA